MYVAYVYRAGTRDGRNARLESLEPKFFDSWYWVFLGPKYVIET
jgi:hypothetical protein